MTAVSFTCWVNDHLLQNSISEPGFPRRIGVEMGREWLPELGFEVLNRKREYKQMVMSEMMWLNTERNFYVNLLLVAS